MFVTDSEVAIILDLPHKHLEPTPAGYAGIFVGVRVRISSVHNHHGLECVG